MSKFKLLCEKYGLDTYKKQRVLRDVFMRVFLETAWKDEDDVWPEVERQFGTLNYFEFTEDNDGGGE